MSGKGKGGKSKAGKKTGGKAISKSKRANITFPVGRIARLLKKGRYANRVGGAAPVYFAAILEYPRVSAELLELAGNAARDHKKTRILPRHIQLAVRNDDELNQLFTGITIASGGVLPSIQPVLLPKSRSKKGAAESQEY
ncbi:late histone H2A.2.2-like [Condylostylus longicornis]|uniref:late histone H2A.2.2-like n=1 Tax=Condylostylus longicornis TaxID=2530218 RepID=UPI00244DF650|nr:late histone H2A.2.2-like [Condylostylus longicornis]